ncbi:MAG: hypothetical protein ACR2L2_07985 [Acidobacteriota bacterium]
MFFWKPAIAVAVLFFSLAAVQAQSNPARSEIVFPLFVMTVPPTLGSGCLCWGTIFEVLNPHPSATTVQYTVFDSNSVVRGVFSDTIAGYSTRGAAFGDPLFGGSGSLRVDMVGWVRIAASQPVVARQRISRTQAFGNQGIPSVATTLVHLVKTPPLPTRREVIRVEYEGYVGGTNTGIAIAFPAPTGGGPVRMKLVFRGVDRIVAERELTIPANGQIVGFVTELLPEILNFLTFERIGGTLELTFDRDVFVTAIQVASPTSFSPERMAEPLAGTIPFLILGQ